MISTQDGQEGVPVKWGKVIDHNRCIGCHACTVACKQEHDVPIGVTRTYVKQVEVGTFPNVRRHFQINRCNQCDDPPCVDICPTAAMRLRPDGIVDFDRDRCIGCKACIAACPYDAIYIDPNSHSAEKCNFCSHRVDRGFQPACVTVCPTQAIFIGNLSDAESEVSKLIAREKLDVRKPEKHTNPRLFYINASQYTLTPTTAEFAGAFPHTQVPETDVRPRENDRLNGSLNKGRRGEAGDPSRTAAAAIISYDNSHRAPWDWRVSLYTWSKSVAAGVFLLAGVLGIAGFELSRALEATAALIALGFLALTAVLLIWDLSHPERFLFSLIKPQPKSWLVWGAYLITAYTGFLGLFLLTLLLDIEGLIQTVRWVGVFLAAGAGGYTALLFGQAKARDLWQEPGLPLHLMLQIGLAGSAVLVLVMQGIDVSRDVSEMVRWVFLGTAGLHLLLSLGHVVMPHPTADGARAARNLAWGRYGSFYWTGIAGGAAVPLLLMLSSTVPGPAASVGAALALVGLALYEHAYVQAAQSVPLS
ncbi:MAG: 4Fe-4S dicluster domain-containing protein [Acidobacteriota bacterium]